MTSSTSCYRAKDLRATKLSELEADVGGLESSENGKSERREALLRLLLLVCRAGMGVCEFFCLKYTILF